MGVTGEPLDLYCFETQDLHLNTLLFNQKVMRLKMMV